MEQFKLRESDEFIKLGQVLKAAGLVENGVEAKEVIQNGLVVQGYFYAKPMPIDDFRKFLQEFNERDNA